MKNQSINIDKLVADSEKPATNEQIKRAIARHKEEEDNNKQRELIIQLREVEKTVNYYVNNLRAARQREKEVKARLVAAVAAKEQFLQDADYTKFAQTINAL